MALFPYQKCLLTVSKVLVCSRLAHISVGESLKCRKPQDDVLLVYSCFLVAFPVLLLLRTSKPLHGTNRGQIRLALHAIERGNPNPLDAT
jgi:hypothetical protein